MARVSAATRTGTTSVDYEDKPVIVAVRHEEANTVEILMDGRPQDICAMGVTVLRAINKAGMLEHVLAEYMMVPGEMVAGALEFCHKDGSPAAAPIKDGAYEQAPPGAMSPPAHGVH